MKKIFFQVDPSKGSVGFGSGLHGWAFTLKQFSEMYAEKFGIDVVKLMKRLWGESFFNPKTKKWSKQKEPDNKRSFCMYVLDPIYKVIINKFFFTELFIIYSSSLTDEHYSVFFVCIDTKKCFCLIILLSLKNFQHF